MGAEEREHFGRTQRVTLVRPGRCLVYRAATDLLKGIAGVPVMTRYPCRQMSYAFLTMVDIDVDKYVELTLIVGRERACDNNEKGEGKTV